MNKMKNLGLVRIKEKKYSMQDKILGTNASEGITSGS